MRHLKAYKIFESNDETFEGYLNDCFIEFIDDEILTISKSNNEYNLYWDFSKYMPENIADKIDSLIKIANYLDDIKTGLDRLMDKYDANITYISDEIGAYFKITLDNISDKSGSYYTISKNKFNTLKSDILEIKIQDILSIQRLALEFGNNLWLRGWSRGEQVFDTEDISDGDYEEPRLLQLRVSKDNWCLSWYDIYYLKGDKFVIKEDRDEEVIHVTSGIKGALDFIRQHLTQELDVYNRR